MKLGVAIRGKGEVSSRARIEPVPGYRLLDRLGIGHTSEVWSAEGPGGFPVALKFVQLSNGLKSVDLRMLSMLRKVRHPHVLAVFGSWLVGDRLILAMELADSSLWDRYREAVEVGLNGIPREELLEALSEAAKGIDYLNGHRHEDGARDGLGIQHRDVKPQSLLIVGGGVKVADFGTARWMDELVTGHSGHSWTPAYAAPEFFSGTTTRYSDQYGLAVTYCHLLGGRLPFPGGSASVMAGHLMRTPDLSMLPEGERSIVARALEKSAENRWPCCRDLIDAIRAVDTRIPSSLTEETAEQKLPPIEVRAPVDRIQSSPLPSPSMKHAEDRETTEETTIDGASSIPVRSEDSSLSEMLDDPLLLQENSLPREVSKLGVWPEPDYDRLRGRLPIAVASLLLMGVIVVHSSGVRQTANRVPLPGPRAGLAAPESVIRPPAASSLRTTSVRTSLRPPASEAATGTLGRPLPEGTSLALTLIPGFRPPVLPPRPRPAAPKESLASEIPSLPVGNLDQAVRTDAKNSSEPTVARASKGPTATEGANLNSPTDREWTDGSVGLPVAGLTEGVKPNEAPLPAPTNEVRHVPSPGQAQRRLGDSLHRKGETERAIAAYSEAIRLDPADASAYLARARIYETQDRHIEVIADGSQALRLLPGSVEALLMRGRAFSAAGRSDRAAADFDEAVRLRPGDASARNARGVAFLASGQLARSLTDLDAAVRLVPSDPILRYNRGRVYALLGETTKSLKDLDEATRLDPSIARVYLLRGDILARIGDRPRAIREFDAAVRLLPSDPAPLNNRGMAYFLDGEPYKAIADFDEAIRVAPNNAVIHYNRGGVYARLGDMIEAISGFDAAIRLNPKFARAYQARGDAYARRGDAIRAEADKEMARRLEVPPQKDATPSRSTVTAGTSLTQRVTVHPVAGH